MIGYSQFIEIESVNAAEVDLSGKAAADNMITLLTKSELNLDAFAIQEQKTVSEEEEESESESDEDEQKPEEPKLPGPKNSKLIGRDENGMFKNHQNFVKLRNKINQQESEHQKMFDSINDKLNDHSFIEQAAKITIDEKMENKAAASVQTKTELKSNATAQTTKKDDKVSSKSEAGMSEADVACYTSKYSDVKGDAREHYLTTGAAQGRSKNCAKNLTDFETMRFINNHPEVQHEFGLSGATTYQLAKQ